MIIRARNLFFLTAALIAVAIPAAQAQTGTYPTFEATGGYQLLHVPDQTFPFGLNLDGAWNVSGSLGFVGEIGWAIGSDSDDAGVDLTFHAWNIGVGPRWNARPSGKMWPFVQVLGGLLHARTSGDVAGVDVSASDTRPMIQPGAGINFNAGDGWGIVGQVDYRRVFLNEDETGESGENEFRVFVGLRLLLD
jgi:hypothetical protein